MNTLAPPLRLLFYFSLLLLTFSCQRETELADDIITITKLDDFKVTNTLPTEYLTNHLYDIHFDWKSEDEDYVDFYLTFIPKNESQNLEVLLNDKVYDNNTFIPIKKDDIFHIRFLEENDRESFDIYLASKRKGQPEKYITNIDKSKINIQGKVVTPLFNYEQSNLQSITNPKHAGIVYTKILKIQSPNLIKEDLNLTVSKNREEFTIEGLHKTDKPTAPITEREPSIETDNKITDIIISKDDFVEENFIYVTYVAVSFKSSKANTNTLTLSLNKAQNTYPVASIDIKTDGPNVNILGEETFTTNIFESTEIKIPFELQAENKDFLTGKSFEAFFEIKNDHNPIFVIDNNNNKFSETERFNLTLDSEFKGSIDFTSDYAQNLEVEVFITEESTGLEISKTYNLNWNLPEFSVTSKVSNNKSSEENNIVAYKNSNIQLDLDIASDELTEGTNLLLFATRTGNEPESFKGKEKVTKEQAELYTKSYYNTPDDASSISIPFSLNGNNTIALDLPIGQDNFDYSLYIKADNPTKRHLETVAYKKLDFKFTVDDIPISLNVVYNNPNDYDIYPKDSIDIETNITINSSNENFRKNYKILFESDNSNLKMVFLDDELNPKKLERYIKPSPVVDYSYDTDIEDDDWKVVKTETESETVSYKATTTVRFTSPTTGTYKIKVLLYDEISETIIESNELDLTIKEVEYEVNFEILDSQNTNGDEVYYVNKYYPVSYNISSRNNPSFVENPNRSFYLQYNQQNVTPDIGWYDDTLGIRLDCEGYITQDVCEELKNKGGYEGNCFKCGNNYPKDSYLWQTENQGKMFRYHTDGIYPIENAYSRYMLVNKPSGIIYLKSEYFGDSPQNVKFRILEKSTKKIIEQDMEVITRETSSIADVTLSSNAILGKTPNIVGGDVVVNGTQKIYSTSVNKKATEIDGVDWLNNPINIDISDPNNMAKWQVSVNVKTIDDEGDIDSWWIVETGGDRISNITGGGTDYYPLNKIGYYIKRKSTVSDPYALIGRYKVKFEFTKRTYKNQKEKVGLFGVNNTKEDIIRFDLELNIVDDRKPEVRF